MGDPPDFHHPMTVTQDQTEGGQPSSPKVGAQCRLYGLCQIFILHWPGVYIASISHKHQTQHDNPDKAENMIVLVSLQDWIYILRKRTDFVEK